MLVQWTQYKFVVRKMMWVLVLALLLTSYVTLKKSLIVSGLDPSSIRWEVELSSFNILSSPKILWDVEDRANLAFNCWLFFQTSNSTEQLRFPTFCRALYLLPLLWSATWMFLKAGTVVYSSSQLECVAQCLGHSKCSVNNGHWTWNEWWVQW